MVLLDTRTVYNQKKIVQKKHAAKRQIYSLKLYPTIIK